MEKKYLVAYHFQSEGSKGFGRSVLRSNKNLKTFENIKKIEKQLSKEAGGNVVILNIIELDDDE